MFTSMRSRRMPALFTTMSTQPNASIACSTSRRAPSKSATFSPSATASPCAASISATTCSAGDRSAPSPVSDPPRSFTTTFAPAAASASACARPMPRPAPVTTATLPLRSGTERSLLEQRRGVFGKLQRGRVVAERVDAPRRVGASVYGGRPRDCLLFARERARPGALVVRDELERLVDGRQRLDVVREVCRSVSDEDRLEIDAHAVPVVDDRRADAGKTHVLRSPVVVADDKRSGCGVAALARAARDLVDPLGARRGRFEVEEDVVRLRPEWPARPGEERRQVGRRTDAARVRDESYEQLREQATSVGRVRVALLAVISPLLERRASAHAERPRTREAVSPQVLLYFLHSCEACGVRIPVHLERDAVPAAHHETEERSDARLESEALDGFRAHRQHVGPDGIRVRRAEERAHDRIVRLDVHS